jgi:hypothetical protein
MILARPEIDKGCFASKQSKPFANHLDNNKKERNLKLWVSTTRISWLKCSWWGSLSHEPIILECFLPLWPGFSYWNGPVLDPCIDIPEQLIAAFSWLGLVVPGMNSLQKIDTNPLRYQCFAFASTYSTTCNTKWL